MNTYYLSLGANLGDRIATLKEAVRQLSQLPAVSLEAVSAAYETAPWGKTDQPAFINAAVKLTTNLTPPELLTETQQIEQKLGRIRHEHWGARTIDIDLLFSPQITWHSDTLTMPHPYLKERAFVLVPLAEIAPDEQLDGQTVSNWLKQCSDKGKVDKLTGNCLK